MTNVDDAKRFMMGVKHVLQNMAVVENLIVMQLVPHQENLIMMQPAPDRQKPRTENANWTE